MGIFTRLYALPLGSIVPEPKTSTMALGVEQDRRSWRAFLQWLALRCLFLNAKLCNVAFSLSSRSGLRGVTVWSPKLEQKVTLLIRLEGDGISIIVPPRRP